MPDLRKTLSISSFNRPQRQLLKACVIFFVPLVIIYAVLETVAVRLPITYKIISEYLQAEAPNIKLMALGSSQVKSAFNPALSSVPAITLASSSQHHKEDFLILQGTIDRLPSLEYVLFEISYMHLELPYHSKDYWKNTMYLKYYGVNAFERHTYFKDKLVYLAHPKYYSSRIRNHYFFRNEDSIAYNKFGFDTGNFQGSFSKLNYDTTLIENHYFKYYTRENLDIFKNNTQYLFKMLDYMAKKKLKVMICTVPLYKTYLKKRNPNIVHRRDSVLQLIQSKYSNVIIIDKETDTTNFKVRDFINENHLNPDGAHTFTTMVNGAIGIFEQ